MRGIAEADGDGVAAVGQSELPGGAIQEVAEGAVQTGICAAADFFRVSRTLPLLCPVVVVAVAKSRQDCWWPSSPA